ncbi:hypothetical protein V6347_16630 [Acinetobacter baumannii]|uniref:hypothetical protein n=1 Tax=Acinetobacter baumannii TaxID=470 RepID=UPI0021475F72|nr:hypothetical protein [Acinetobacter baumannii]MCR0007697.1 hypothetical protein [Acinetobacter baumannii]MDC5141371.1 hypothetical protein [Acinetobacter baumannii]HAV3581140.1 hypothetical protein [Acinetobacter baumannii]
MELDLNEKYRVVTDEYNFILQEKRIIGSKKPATRSPDASNVGKVKYTNLGYYSNLSSLVHGLITREIRISEVDEINEIEMLVKKYTQEIVDNLSLYGIKKEVANYEG